MGYWKRVLLSVAVATAITVATGCGSTPSASKSPPSQSATTASIPSPSTAAPTALPAPTPPPTPAASAAQLQAVGTAVYPDCHDTCAGQDNHFASCDFGNSGASRWANCPLTPRLITQLNADVQGVPSAAEPLGGGQDPYWATESITADPGPAGGLVHAALGYGGNPSTRTDLVVVVVNGRLLVDDVYCTGSNPSTSDAYAPGWLNRSNCHS